MVPAVSPLTSKSFFHAKLDTLLCQKKKKKKLSSLRFFRQSRHRKKLNVSSTKQKIKEDRGGQGEINMNFVIGTKKSGEGNQKEEGVVERKGREVRGGWGERGDTTPGPKST